MRKGVIMNSSAPWLCQDWMSEHAVIIPQGNDWLHSFSPLHFLWQPALQSSYTVWPTAVWHLLVLSLHDFFKAPTHTHAHTHSREASRLFSLLVFLGKCVICSSQRFWNVVWWPLIHPTVHPSQQGGWRFAFAKDNMQMDKCISVRNTHTMWVKEAQSFPYTNTI